MHEPIAYAFNADHYCESCMLDYARSVPYDEYVWAEHDSEDERYHSSPGILFLPALIEDGIIRDNESNMLHALFSWQEWYNIGEGTQTLNCNVCHTELDTYEEDDDA